MLDISTAVGTASGDKKVGDGNISPTAFRRRIVRYWHPLGCRAIELEKPSYGGVMYTVVYGYPITQQPVMLREVDML